MAKETVTRELLTDGLRSIGLSEGMQVEVHSSLSSFGYVEEGASTVISALMDVVTEKGSIVMPAFLMSKQLELTEDDKALGIKCKIRLLSPELDEDSGMGLISDTFRRMPGVVTGAGPFRVSAWGRDSEVNSRGFSNLITRNGWALLLGVDIYALSSMHYVESRLPDEIRSIFAPNEDVLRVYPQDRWFVETGEPPVKAWHKIQGEAYEKGYIKDAYIGRSKCMFFKIRDVVGLYERALEADPLGLYGLR